jgi:ATP-dependent DNA helicase RecG
VLSAAKPRIGAAKSAPADAPPGLEAATAGMEPLAILPGFTPRLGTLLERLGLERVRDAWFHLPLRFEDRTQLTPIRQLIPGQRAQVEGVVDAVERGFRFKPQLKVALSDEPGATLVLRFFQFHAGQVQQLQPGVRLRCFGEARHGAQGLEMIHPSYRRIGADEPLQLALTPVYPTVDGLPQHRLRKTIAAALARLPDDAGLELLPEALRERSGLGPLATAIRELHSPVGVTQADAISLRQHPAQRRIAFEELLAHRLGLRMRRRALERRPGPRISTPGARRAALLKQLPFALTRAQRRVLAEIQRDLGSGKPMLRLLQGDVGSGKTVVAALAALAVIDAGWQVAVMAPTEVLAEQHLRNFSRWLVPLGLEPVWLAGKVQGRARTRALASVATEATLVIGTHALMQQGVEFRRLGLAVVDEQHRFGVHQRLALAQKGQADAAAPHQLVMTATPIPRTLAMAAYADLDTSVLDELPPGRSPVTTVAISNQRRAEVMQRIRAACGAGRQAYWVCTLIDESEQLEAQAAAAAHDELSKALPELKVGLVHGRMKPREKQAAMAAFERGETGLLVATTVIEVGVDVPNASLMVIENAERLGLAQLHQLRGRVGRGEQAASCVLMYQPPLSEPARQRLALLRATTDGFRIAEEDLRLRGPGELLGTRQTGLAGFRVADLGRDAALLPDIAKAAEWMLSHDPNNARALVRRWIGSALRYAEA